MDATLLEQLLYEDESATLDFKKEQYKFVKASEDEKSELLKDIVGFANGWGRGDRYILIGVEEVVGDRSNVLGITDHLADHALQQFVNNLTNRPVQFGYEACPLEEQQVGVIRIDQEQQRPIYLKKDYGKLKRGKVYVRRGSSIDPSKPATPDEIAHIGKVASQSSPEAEMLVEFADPDREVTFGASIPWSAELCDIPKMKDIPSLSRPRRVNPLGINLDAVEGITGDLLNTDYYRDLANYEFFHRLFRRVRIVVTNTGKVAAENVRVEIAIPKGHGIFIHHWSEVPKRPKRKESRFAALESSMNQVRSVFTSPGHVDIDTDEDRFKLEIECKDLQPGRKVWSDDFYLGVCESGECTLKGHSFAANLSKPKQFILTLDADVAQTSMTVEALIKLADEKHSDYEVDD